MSTINEALNVVARALASQGIEKAGVNAHGKYKFRGIDQVYNSLSTLLAENGLMIRPFAITDKVIETVTTSGGKPSTRVSMDVTFRISNMTGDSIDCIMPGEAMDTSDKATNKAMTSAYKYLVFQLFCIPTEGAPDADTDHLQVAAEALDQEQINAIMQLMSTTNTDLEPFLAWQKVDAMTEIPAHRYEQVIASLERKQQRMAHTYANQQAETAKSLENS